MKTAISFLLLAAPLVAMGADSESGTNQFFEEKIRPALSKYCYECHSEESGKAKGGLRVDTRHALLQGGDTGAAVTPGDLEASLLLDTIRYVEPDMEMPPDGKLPNSVVADFEKWIKSGAPDPRGDSTPVEVKSEIDLEAGRQFWSFKPLAEYALPSPEDPSWSQMDIDRFVLAKLDQNGMKPAPAADSKTLIRRLYFTLTGLPPSPDDIKKWETSIGVDLDQTAILGLTDYLLASPRFGEHWGQHWLDVARHADSTGGDSNNIYPHAWRYRNYVIDAFNADKPFDQFIREQVAGDLLPVKSQEKWGENLVATGFLALGQKLVGEVDDRKFLADQVDEQIDTTTRAFLGLSVACARCHDHKSDPIPQSDYYAFAAIFRNTETLFGLFDEQSRQHATLIDASGLGLPAGREALTREQFAQLVREHEEAEENMDALMGRIRGGGEKVSRANLRRSRSKRGRAESALEAYDETGTPRCFVMGTQDLTNPVETRLLVRGEIDRPGQIVGRGFPRVVADPGKHLIRDSIPGSGRRQLADWISDPNNPLTARVITNRVWAWVFGQGLVRSADDFGATGDLPSHPELLDHLTGQFIADDWSIKDLIRRLTLSRSFQQSSQFHPAHFEIDPDNRLLWRANQRRLGAEAIRDAYLVAAGKLDVSRPTIPLLSAAGEGTVGQNVFEPDIREIDGNVRSIYLPRVRNVLPAALDLFDVPDASGVAGNRNTTTVPLQALFAMNSPFVREQADALASRLQGVPASEQLELAHLIAFGRPTNSSEQRAASIFAKEFRSGGTLGSPADLQRETMAAYCHALMCAAEFSIID